MRPAVASQFPLVFLLLAAPLALGTPAAFAERPPGWTQGAKRPRAAREDGRKLRRARQVLPLPSSVLLLIGERLSFRGVRLAGVQDPGTLQIEVEEGILTVRGRKEGRTTLYVHGNEQRANPEALSSPREIPVTVKR